MRWLNFFRRKLSNLKLEMCGAACYGDWEKAEAVFKGHPKEITQSTWLKALHIAARAGHTVYVEKLLETQRELELTIKDVRGETPLFTAVQHGRVEIARIMLNKEPDLATIRSRSSLVLPIEEAALRGYYPMVCLLFEASKNQLEDSDWIDALVTLIKCGFYDIAKEILSDNPGLAIQANSNGETAILAIAENFSNTRSSFRPQVIELIEELLQQADGHGQTDLIKEALFRAAQGDNPEFLTAAIQLYPKLEFQMDENGHTIFHVAVLNRHINVFNILHRVNSDKHVIKAMKDKEGNNILHMVAKMPKSGLEVVPGAAFQLQWELHWFEEVKKLDGPQHVEPKNEIYMQLFKKEHEKLRREGEKWLKKTAEVCLVVATLITTVSFAASFSAPGRNEKHAGISPILLDNIWFKVFATSNAISLMLSVSSVLLFLSFFTSTYSMNDFLKSLPFKLLSGLFLLSTSILVMMVGSVAAFFGVFKHHELQFLAFPVAVVAVILAIFVAHLHLPHFYHVFRWTLKSSLQFGGTRILL